MRLLAKLVVLVPLATACADDDATGRDPTTSPRASIDRFSSAAGHLMIRDATNGLPEANAAINFDQPPFITRGLGPQGGSVRYYNFDVQPTQAAPIYALFDSSGQPIAGQLNIVDALPGDAGYNDFWNIIKVTVPDDYVANTVTSLAELESAGYPMTPTQNLVNCPIVPDGSTASLGGGAEGLHLGWYRDQVVSYFTFEEKALTLVGNEVPVSPIYVTFNINPDQPGGGPAAGFKVEATGDQTHNVVATLPTDSTYSPLWFVNVYDNASFDQVSDLTTAQSASILAEGVANVNCPLVDM